MAPRRFNIESLVTQHGVEGLAEKVGVHTRTVRRWRNDGTEPSPLAKEKLTEILKEADTLDPKPVRKTLQLPPEGL